MTTLREKMKQEMTLCGYSLATQTQYLYAIKKLHDHHKKSPAQLSNEEIKAFFVNILFQKSYAASTYNVIFHGVKFFYERVLNKKIEDIHLPRKKDHQKLPDILSQSEITQIIKNTRNLMHRTIFIVIYGAGLRVSEAISLRINDIDSERSVIHIRESKGNKDRYVPLSPFMLNSLRFYWKHCRVAFTKKKCAQHFIQEKNALLFLNQSGKPLSASSVGAIYKRQKRATGIQKQGSIHGLRHAFATHTLESGVDLYTIKQILGHASITSTARYLRMTDKLAQKVKSPIEQLML